MITIGPAESEFIEKRQDIFPSRVIKASPVQLVQYLRLSTWVRGVRCDDLQRYASLANLVSGQPNGRKGSKSQLMDYAISTLTVFIAKSHWMIPARAVVLYHSD